MSALTDLFQSMANKIRSKTGTATTYTPPQMVADGIDDVFDAGVASATTPITPSNSSPVAMAANTGYKPTASGYAISSYATVTPSNSSPVGMGTEAVYKVSSNGALVSNITSITPSNSEPPSVSSSYIYKPTGNGKVVASVATKTPSDTSPSSVTALSIIQPSSNGYLYATQQTKSITLLGSITIADTSNHTVTFSQSIKGFRYILVCMGGSVTTNKYYNNNTGGGCGSVIIFDSDKWVSGFTLDGGYTTGSSGSQSTRTDTITYSSNTAMIIKHSNNTSRTDYIYGLN